MSAVFSSLSFSNSDSCFIFLSLSGDCFQTFRFAEFDYCFLLAAREAFFLLLDFVIWYYLSIVSSMCWGYSRFRSASTSSIVYDFPGEMLFLGEIACFASFSPIRWFKWSILWTNCWIWLSCASKFIEFYIFRIYSKHLSNLNSFDYLKVVISSLNFSMHETTSFSKFSIPELTPSCPSLLYAISCSSFDNFCENVS